LDRRSRPIAWIATCLCRLPIRSFSMMMKSGPRLGFGTTGFEYIRRKKAGHESNSVPARAATSRSFQTHFADDTNVLYHNDGRLEKPLEPANIEPMQLKAFKQ
jgi:hypothetical protein